MRHYRARFSALALGLPLSHLFTTLYETGQLAGRLGGMTPAPQANSRHRITLTRHINQLIHDGQVVGSALIPRSERSRRTTEHFAVRGKLIAARRWEEFCGPVKTKLELWILSGLRLAIVTRGMSHLVLKI